MNEAIVSTGAQVKEDEESWAPVHMCHPGPLYVRVQREESGGGTGQSVLELSKSPRHFLLKRERERENETCSSFFFKEWPIQYSPPSSSLLISM